MQRDIEINPFNSIPNQEGTWRTIRVEDGKYNSHTLFPSVGAYRRNSVSSFLSIIPAHVTEFLYTFHLLRFT